MMEEAILDFWEGSDEPSGGRVVNAESRWGLDVATDYDKACDVNDFAGVIEVDRGRAFVLSTNGDAMATWLPNFEGFAGAFVEWGYADNERDLVEEASCLIRESAFSETHEFNIHSGPCVLFVAAERGREDIYPRQTFDLTPGKYVVRTGVRTTEQTSVVCHVFHLEGQSL